MSDLEEFFHRIGSAKTRKDGVPSYTVDGNFIRCDVCDGLYLVRDILNDQLGPAEEYHLERDRCGRANACTALGYMACPVTTWFDERLTEISNRG